MAQHIPIDSFDFKPEVKEAILEMWDNGKFSMIEDFSISGMLRYDLDNEWVKEDKRLKKLAAAAENNQVDQAPSDDEPAKIDGHA